ncbi:MAG TPA: hypothetical protein VNN08_17415 [Thermoanaerobaculia bacterium]|nr:hypothetical protein [Thermoanaerobaculia bacterium]
MFWQKKQKCDRCGTVLPRRRKGEATPEGEGLCVQCAISVFGHAVHEATGPAIETFLSKTLKTISLQTDVDQSLFSARCQTVIGSDVEIRRTPRGYNMTFYTQLLDNPAQTAAVIKYVVGWIKSNPLVIKPLIARRIGTQILLPGNIFLFLFIPASSPLPTDKDIDFITYQIVPYNLPEKLGWLVCAQPYDQPDDNISFIAETLESWLVKQTDRDSIKMVPKPVQTEAGRKLNCLMVYRDKTTAKSSGSQDERR